MKRMALVIVTMVTGISLMLWAGWHNLRERRLALERAQENHIVLAPVVPGQKGTESAESDSLDKMRGKIAPGFTLVSLEGKKVSLADYKGRPVLVNFWATWCAPCKLEMPWFEEYRAKYAAQGFEVLGIAEDDAAKEDIAKAAKKLGATYPILLTDGKVAPAYGGVDYLPMSFYVDAKGVVVEQTAGLASKDEVEANIKKLLGAGMMQGLVLGLALLAGSVVAQDSPKPKQTVMYVAEPQRVAVGKHAELAIKFKVLDGYHVNSHLPKSDFLIPTVLKVDTAAGVTTGTAAYSAGQAFSFAFSPDEKLDVYTGEFTVKLPVTAAAGEHTLDATLHYQACDHAACYPPKSLPLQVLFTAK